MTRAPSPHAAAAAPTDPTSDPTGRGIIAQRTIPIFEALRDADPEQRFHRTRGQLAYALQEQLPPDWPRAIEMFDEAIRIRDRERAGGYLLYEFCRALCRIGLDLQSPSAGVGAAGPAREQILADLRKAASDPDIRRKIQAEFAGRGTDDRLRSWFLRANLTPAACGITEFSNDPVASTVEAASPGIPASSHLAPDADAR